VKENSTVSCVAIAKQETTMPTLTLEADIPEDDDADFLFLPILTPNPAVAQSPSRQTAQGYAEVDVLDNAAAFDVDVDNAPLITDLPQQFSPPLDSLESLVKNMGIQPLEELNLADTQLPRSVIKPVEAVCHAKASEMRSFLSDSSLLSSNEKQSVNDDEIIEITDYAEDRASASGLAQLLRWDAELLNLCSQRLSLTGEELLATDFLSLPREEPVLRTMASALCERLAAWQQLLNIFLDSDIQVRMAITRISCFLGLKPEFQFDKLYRTGFSVDFLVPKPVQEKLTDFLSSGIPINYPVAILSTEDSSGNADFNTRTLTNTVVAESSLSAEVIEIDDDDSPTDVEPKAMPHHWLKVQDFARERLPSSEETRSLRDLASSVEADTKAPVPVQHSDGSNPSVACFLSFSRESGYQYVLIKGLGRYCIHRSTSTDAVSIQCLLFIEAGYHKTQLKPEVYPSFERMQLEFFPSAEAPTFIRFHGAKFSLSAQLPVTVEKMKEMIISKVPYFFVLKKNRENIK
jgi:hypothetical protein